MNRKNLAFSIKLFVLAKKHLAESRIEWLKGAAAYGFDIPEGMTDIEINWMMHNLSTSFPKVERLNMQGRRVVMCYPFS